jgi:sorting nexin-17
MHFSIPDTSEVEDDSGKFTTYNIYTNGAFHCSVRYSQLLEFSEQVKKEFTSEGLPPFPKKRIKFLRLTPAEMEERREMLEKYLQSGRLACLLICGVWLNVCSNRSYLHVVSQVPRIAKSNLFTGFLLSAQQVSSVYNIRYCCRSDGCRGAWTTRCR